MQKRMTLTSVADDVPTSSKSVDKKNKKKQSEQVARTIRLSLQLHQPTKDTCCEFNFDDLIRKAELESKKKKTASADPFGDENEDEEVARLARNFEEKYGNKKKRSGWEDYVDKGMGYDETDPFIDNDEAYDELIPSSLSTKYGGFYVNTGQLEFTVVAAPELPADSDPTGSDRPSGKNQVSGKRRKSLNNGTGSVSESNANIVKKKKKDHTSDPKTVAQMIDQKRQKEQQRDLDEDPFVPPIRKNRPVIHDDDEEDNAPCSQTVIDVIDSVARGRPNGSPLLQNQSGSAEKASVIRTAGETSRPDGAAINSLARMAAMTSRNDLEQQRPQFSSSHNQQQHRPRQPADLSTRSPEPTASFRPHPGLVDQKPQSLLSRGTSSNAPQSILKHSNFDRQAGPSHQKSPQPIDHPAKQSPTSAQIRSSFQSVIKTSVEPKRSSEMPTMESLMEKVISNTLSKSYSSSLFSAPSPASAQNQTKNFKSPPAAHQQPKNSFSTSFLEPAPSPVSSVSSVMRNRSPLCNSPQVMEAMIREHLTPPDKTPPLKHKSDPQAASSSTDPNQSHAKVVRIKDQYRIPNLPQGPKSSPSPSSSPAPSSSPSPGPPNRPNNLPTVSGRHQQFSGGNSQQHQQQKVPKAPSPASGSTPVMSPLTSQPKPKVAHSSRSSPSHSRHSPLTSTDQMVVNPYSSVIQSPQQSPAPLWNPMTMPMAFSSMFDPAYLSSRTSPAGLSPLARTMPPVTQSNPSLTQSQFLSLHSYAAPPGGKDGPG